jgi:hypothetical protein
VAELTRREPPEQEMSTPMITQSDHSTLARALVLKLQHGAGIFPAGSGQTRQFKKLEAAGWLRFDNYGFDMDGEVEREVPVYQLTERGEMLARLLEGEESNGAERGRIIAELDRLLALDALPPSELEEADLDALIFPLKYLRAWLDTPGEPEREG